jgi:hypothetical protein
MEEWASTGRMDGLDSKSVTEFEDISGLPTNPFLLKYHWFRLVKWRWIRPVTAAAK